MNVEVPLFIEIQVPNTNDFRLRRAIQEQDELEQVPVPPPPALARWSSEGSSADDSCKKEQEEEVKAAAIASVPRKMQMRTAVHEKNELSRPIAVAND